MRLSVYIWSIDHWGTVWSHVLTDVKSEVMLGPVFGWALYNERRKIICMEKLMKNV